MLRASARVAPPQPDAGRSPAIDALATTAVLCAALLHAGWNAALKRQSDPLLGVAGLAAGSVALALVALPWLPLPHADAWPWIAGSICVHIPYQVALASAYKRGELGTLYALMRGLPPMIVAIVGTTLLADLTGDTLGRQAMVGIALVCLGLLTLLRSRPQSRHALAFAAVAACCTATYTLLDGLGSRASLHPVSYVLWHSALQGSVLIAVVAARRGVATLRASLRREAATALIGGVASVIAYGLALWAMSRAPIATVAALRETSVIFAAWIGVWLFGEPIGWRRVVATLLVVAGGVVLRSA